MPAHPKALLRGVVVMSMALLASASIGASWMGRWLAGLTLDQVIRRTPSVDEKQIILIDITEGDYDAVFHRKRPLDPDTIVELIRGAFMGGAKLIAVDVSTQDWPKDFKLKLPDRAAVVWARGFYLEPGRRNDDYIMEDLLGNAAGSANECYGIPALEEEAGVVRSFYPNFRIYGRPEPQPSFVSQILYRYTNQSCQKTPEPDDRPIIVTFSAIIQRDTAETLRVQARQKGWEDQHRYAGKIVIIGGTFHTGMDMHDTPVGALSGLDINGQSVSSVLRRQTHREVSEVWSLCIDFCIGVALLLCGIMGRRVQLAATIVAVLLSLILSVYLYRQYYLFLSSLPILFGIFLHWRLERADEVQPTLPKK